MTIWRVPAIARVVLACGLVCLANLAAAEPEPAKTEPLIVIDGGGKEHKIKTWKLSTGTRRLAWLAPEGAPEPKDNPKDPKEPKGKVMLKAVGPEALEFREEQSTNFVDGILTLVPLDRVRSLDYDAETQTVTLHVATTDKKEADVALKGTTKYQGINKLAIEAEVDKGDLGVAEIKFLGGTAKGGIRGIRFPAPKGGPKLAEATTSITSTDKKDKEPYKVTELQALYRTADGGQKLLPTVMFKKTLKLDLGKIKKVHLVEGSKRDAPEWTVTLADGEEHTLTLLLQTPDDKPLHLEGLLGKVPAGYKFFPIGLVQDILVDGKAE